MDSQNNVIFQLFDSAKSIVEKQSNVDINLNEIDKDIDKLIEAFRRAYAIREHNDVDKQQTPLLQLPPNLLCYDLMFCENPYEETLRQKFFTFFSQEGVSKIKKQGEKIYSRYLTAYPKLHIDTMLQISYSKIDKLCDAFPEEKRQYVKQKLQKGVCLIFPPIDTLEGSIGDLNIIDSADEPFYISLPDNVANTIRNLYKNLKDLGIITIMMQFKDLYNRERDLVKKIDEAIKLIEEEIDKVVTDFYNCNGNINSFSSNPNFVNSYIQGTYIYNENTFKNFLRVCIVNILAVPGMRYLYFIPIPFLNNRRIGHAAFSTKSLMQYCEIRNYTLVSYVMMTSLVQFNVASQFLKKSQYEAIKSAKAAIMSRNMSHNIGSHVMSYLKQHLGSVKDIVADGILSDLINGENELAKKLENTTENTTLPFLMGLGHFVSYLQERQDFIATIATDYIPYFGNVNFKDSIYDELNPDKRAERHSERKNGKTDNILLGNIARSEGLGRRTTITADNQLKESELRDIVLRFRNSFDGNRVVDIDDSGNIKDIINQDAYDELEEMRKYDFSLPGGIVGRQAFFSIMENIIRNAAKHGNWREQKNLEFTFDIFSCKKEDFNRLPSNDNVNEHCLSLKEVIEKFYLNAKDSKDLYFVTITDNCNFTTVSKTGDVLLTALGKLRNALTSNYISDSGEMENENKGLKEMRISAAWMRAIKDETMCFSPYIHVNESEDTKLLEYDKYEKDTNLWKTKNTNQKAPLLYARISAKKVYDDDEEFVIGRNLQYIFCVQIPKKVAVILNNSEIEIGIINNNLERINWRAYTVEGFSKERNRSYEFILIDDECGNIEQTYFNIRSEATARTFRFSEIKDLNRDLFVKRLKEENYDGKDDLRLFYKSLADYQESDRIIVDDKTAAVRNKDNNNVHISVGDGINEEGIKYIYRRHHEAEMEFTAFMTSKMKDSVEFVEGISGNNSTDRLIRNEELDDSWFYRHLRAMKQQIAIFDERLFSKITGLEESDFNGSNTALCKDNTALSYIQKGIYPFTFISDKTNGNIKLIGILFDKQPLFEEQIVRDDPQAPVHSYKCFCGCIANITFKNKQLKTDYNNYGEYIKKHFHAVTIHQGLLDKIYELFEIKGSETEKSDKEIVTSNLFQIFSCNRPIVLKEDYATEKALKKEFLPGLIIHSGRSKPNESDMPQKLPFIQYAALEHAVMDCKYSLVELLDFARYES